MHDVRLGQPARRIATREMEFGYHVAARIMDACIRPLIRMQQRRPRLHGRLRVEHRRQHLVYDLQSPAARFRHCLALRQHAGDPLPDEAHDIVQHPRIGRIVQRIFMLRSGERPKRRPRWRQHAMDTRDRHSGRSVDRNNPRVGVGRAQQLQVPQPRLRRHIQRISNRPGDHRRPRRGRNIAAERRSRIRRVDMLNAGNGVGDRAISGAAAEISFHRRAEVLKLFLVQ